MFALCSNITLGIFNNVKPHSVKVTKSMFSYVDRAEIKLPISSRIISQGQIVSESAETAKQFIEGERVVIKLGYNNRLKVEFEGFVSRINFTSPVEVECEGFSYQLRKKTYKRTFVNTQLREILDYLIQGTDIKLDADIPSFKIDKFILQQHNGTEALEKLKKDSDNNIQIFFTGNVLYAGLQYLNPKADVKYRLGWNVIKDGNLKQRQAKNQDVTVHYIGENNDGTKTKVTAKHNSTTGSAGVSGEIKIIKSHSIRDEASLTDMANKKLKLLSFNGYQGSITAFGTPYCEPGYRVILQDDKYAERGGKYLVESVEINYSTSGFRRIVGIGAEL